MIVELSPTQALALWGLLARQGRAAAAAVKPKADRDALVASGLVELDGKSATLTDRGWRWASEHLSAPLPSAQATLGLLLLRVDAHLRASGATLAEFIGEAPLVPEPKPVRPTTASPRRTAAPKAPEAEADSRPKAPRRSKAPTAAALRAMIEAAYLRASGGARSEPVRLSRLRAEIGDIDRKVVDAGLARILKAKKETASLSQIGDNKAIDAAEREAAFSPAGDPFHLIRIK